MRLQLRCHGDIDLSQPGMQVEIRSHIARCLRDYPNGGEGVITLAGVEHCWPFRWTKSADQILASVKRFCHKAQQTLCSEL